MNKIFMCAVSLFCSLCFGAGVLFVDMTVRQSSTMASNGSVSEVQTWYYDQLDDVAANLYDAMSEWNSNKGFAKGNGDIKLVEGGYVTDAQLTAYVNGDSSLAQSFQNARDAFFHDNEDLFYIDSTKLTMRVGQLNGKMVAYINSGENPNYYANGFTDETQVTSAIADSNQKLAGIISSMQAQLDSEFPSKSDKTDSGKPMYPSERVVTIAHDALIRALNYTYPSATALYVAGTYALKDGKANCEGYSRLFKSLMEHYNIPCVLIEGTAENARSVLEQHMWNYVYVNAVWYAVDVTWDDPIQAIKEDVVRDTYLLRGEYDFSSDHFSSGIFSPGGKEFSYPALNLRNYGDIILETGTSDGIEIYAEKGTGDVVNTSVNFSYQEKNVSALEKMGLYLAGQFCYYGEDPQPWVPMHVYNLFETEKYSRIPVSKRGHIRFCVVDFNALTPDGKQAQTYSEDLSEQGKNMAITDSFEIPYYDDYMPQPFIFKCEPSLSRKIEAEETPFSIIYDDEFVVESGKSLKATVISSENIPGELTDLKMEPTTITKQGFKDKPATKVTFKFTPDNSYQSYINRYSIRLDNVTGKSSGKAPNLIPVCVGFDMSIPCPSLVASGYLDNKAFVIGLPTLVVNPDADIFEYDGGKDITALDIRLVATKPLDKQEEFENLTGESDIKASDVYDLSLSCQNYAARLKSDVDYNLTVGIPYPEGYNYNSNSNVTFKAYHYKWVNGEYVAEEIVCRIGERGLEVVVDSFSPFLIAVVPKTDITPKNKLVNVVSRTRGGDILTEIADKNGNPVMASSSGLYSMESGSKTFTVQPKQGFVVDKVLLNNKLIELNNNKVTFDFDTMAADNDLEVFFVSETVKELDSKKGFVEIVSSLKREASSMTITTLPNKINYQQDEAFDSTGMKVVLTYNDNTTKELVASDYIISGTDKLSDGENIITVTLKANSAVKATFTINVEGKFNPTVLIVCLLCGAFIIVAVIFALWYIKRKKKSAR